MRTLPFLLILVTMLSRVSLIGAEAPPVATASATKEMDGAVVANAQPGLPVDPVVAPKAVVPNPDPEIAAQPVAVPSTESDVAATQPVAAETVGGVKPAVDLVVSPKKEPSTQPEEVVKSPPIAVAAPTPVATAPAVDLRADLLSARVTLLEQQLLAQQEREVTLYRDTIRLITIFGGAFAGLCMVGLLAASFLNYRALVAVQGAYARGPVAPAVGDSNSLLAAPGAIPGIDRVQASGQRFQSRVSGLEERLAELEHLAGRDTVPMADAEFSVASPAEVGEAIPLAPPRRMIPRAMILVHKAQTLSNLGKVSEALATLEEAATLGESRIEVHLARGQVLEKLGRLGDALDAYDAAVGGDDQNTSALLLKAGVLNRQERFSDALACYERALEVHRASS